MEWITGSGRIGRLRYLVQSTLIAGAMFALLLGGALTGPTRRAGGPAPAGPSPLLVVLLVTVLPAGAWLSYAAAVRRLHDCGRSGWTLLWTFVPFGSAVLGLYLLFCPGEAGANAYGPPPGGPDVETLKRQLEELERRTGRAGGAGGSVPALVGARSSAAVGGSAPADTEAPSWGPAWDPAPATPSPPSSYLNPDGTFDMGGLARDNPGLHLGPAEDRSEDPPTGPHAGPPASVSPPEDPPLASGRD